MKRRTRLRHRAAESLDVHHLAEGEQLAFCEADRLILVVHGACAIRGATERPERLAARVAHASEFAFSRAFKRRHGVAPGSFRRLPATMRAQLSPLGLAA